MTATPATVGRYHIVRLIAHGGMGSLYLARDPAIDRLVAIKLLKHDFDDEGLRDRFTREARATGGLRHPNIVTIFDVGEHDSRPFIAMEYVPGETLDQMIRRRAPVPLAEKLGILEDLCSGLHSAHAAGIVHRDVKPANVMVDIHGTLKILDFGIARFGEAGTTQAGDVVGTLNYMSPEQLTGAHVDHRADVYAVGVLAYELLSYQKAFPGTIQEGVLYNVLHATPPSLQQLVPDLDPAITAIVERAMARRPDDRYQDLESLRVDLSAVRSRVLEAAPVSGPVTAPDAETSLDPVGSGRRQRPATGRQTSGPLATGVPPQTRPAWAARARRFALPAGLGAAGLLALIIVLTWRSGPAPAEPRATPDTSPVAATPPSTPAPAPPDPDTSSERGSIEEQLQTIRTAARQHMAARRYPEALDSASAGLILDGGDSELRALVDEVLRTGRRAATAARQSAAREGATEATSVDFRDARARERESESLQRSGDRVGAARGLFAAAALFEHARRLAAQSAARRPAPEPDPPPARKTPTREEQRPPPPQPAEPLVVLPGTTARAPAPPTAPKAHPPPAPAGLPPDPREVETRAVTDALTHYADAYTRRDIEAVRKILPRFTENQLRGLERDFSNYRSYSVEFADVSITLGRNLATATATATVTRSFETRTGQRGNIALPTTFHLRKVGGAWVIERLESR